MMEKLIEIQLENASGSIVPIRCRRIISIDGTPYDAPVDNDWIVAHLNHFAGRLEAIEAIVGNRKSEI